MLINYRVNYDVLEHKRANLYLKWEVRVSTMGPLRWGPKGRTDGVGQYKTPAMRDSTHSEAKRAKRPLYRVMLIDSHFLSFPFRN